MDKRSIQLLQEVFLADGAQIVKVEGTESGYDHLRIYTQDDEQREAGVAMLHRIYMGEVIIPNRDIKNAGTISVIVATANQKSRDGIVFTLEALQELAQKNPDTWMDGNRLMVRFDKYIKTPIEILVTLILQGKNIKPFLDIIDKNAG